MIDQQKSQQLARCRSLIEQKLGWGSGDSWTNQDFEQLSDQLAGQTGVTLSITTLKRVWGRVKYDSAPTSTTLNALASFLGYENWRSFQHAQQDVKPLESGANEHEFVIETPRRKLILTRIGAYQWKAVVVLAICLGVVAAFIRRTPAILPVADYSLSSSLVAKGLPNSVIFNYNAAASPTDSIFVQQSWDPKRRQLVPKNGHSHTSIYYYPGYYQAKLVVGEQVMQQHDLLIPSDGWNVAVRQEPVPVYFPVSEAIGDGSLHLAPKDIENRNIPLHPVPPKVQYRYVQDFKHFMTDNFVFETRLKNEFKQGSAACQKTSIVILCRNEFLSIPLVAKGCVGNLRLHLAGDEANSNTSDLSGFGTDLSQWVDFRCEVHNKQLAISINGVSVYEAVLANKPIGIVGISYVFEGSGSVDYTRFSRTNGEVVFEDDFDK